MKQISKKQILTGFLFAYCGLLFVSAWLRPNFDRDGRQEVPGIDEQKLLLRESFPAGVWVEGNGQVIVWNKTGVRMFHEETPSIERLVDRISKGFFTDEPSALVVGEGYGAIIAMAAGQRLEPHGKYRIVLIDPKGVPSFEWLGNPILDRSLRSVQFGALWLAQRVIPFSYLRGITPTVSLFESALVAEGKIPSVLLVHQKMDPVCIVSDHEEASSQSAAFCELVQPSFLLSRESWDNLIFDQQIASIFNNDGATESNPVPVRFESYLSRTQTFAGASLWVAMLLIALSTLISEDLACIGSGILVAHGAMGWLPAIFSCVAGIYVGDLLLYLLGRVAGESLLTHRPFRWMLARDAVVASEQWFQQKGAWVILACRFMPGTRVPVYFAAGVLRYAFWRVSSILLIAAILWVPVLVGLSAWLGEKLLIVYERYEHWAVWFIIAAIVLIFLVIHRLIPLLTHKGRLLAFSRWKRLTRWEFWPAKAIYPPVVLYLVYLGFRYRSLTLPTLANPMLPCGGFIDESKLQILNILKAANAPVADFVEVDAIGSVEDRMVVVQAAMERWGGGYPVVLKPDQGERGKGVAIVKSMDQLRSVLMESHQTLIAQKYVPGKEFGVFYWRMPEKKTGEIPSITRKKYTSVIGDGFSNLEQLILNDARAVCSAETFLKAHKNELFRIPSTGERVTLVEIGTHARGSLFLDACELATDELREVLDRISLDVDGYYLGRFDLKVPDDESLRQGKNIQILELNLLTSEPTHMYDPKHTIWFAWRLLIRQWRTAFEIGDQVRKQGKKPMKLSEIIEKIWRRYS